MGRPVAAGREDAPPAAPPRALPQVARSLTIACFLDSKLGVLQQQQSAGSRHVSGLVEDARAPLQALCTLGGMLAPRLEEGEPEQVGTPPRGAAARPQGLA